MLRMAVALEPVTHPFADEALTLDAAVDRTPWRKVVERAGLDRLLNPAFSDELRAVKTFGRRGQDRTWTQAMKPDDR